MIDQDFLLAYQQCEKQLNVIALNNMLNYFNRHQLFVSDEICEFQTIVNQLNVQGNYQKFLLYMLRVLCDNALLRVTQNGYQKIRSFSMSEIDEVSQEIQLSYATFLPLYRFLLSCCETYDEVLSGEKNGALIAYPGGDIHYLKPMIELVNRIYGLQDQVRGLLAYIKKLSSNHPISILEVGGGVGQVTWQVLSELNDLHNIQYFFTDISRFFLMHAKEKMATLANETIANHVHYQQFDMNQPAYEQGFSKDQFDVIIAVNVVHIAPNIKHSLLNLQAVMKEQGVLWLVEHRPTPVWMNAAWGILEGWWLFNDDCRDSLPFMNEDDWRSMLISTGFNPVQEANPARPAAFEKQSYISFLANKQKASSCFN